jgi:hypothetical protein
VANSLTLPKEFEMDVSVIVRLEPETVLQMDITTNKNVAAKWYWDWHCAHDLAANEFKISAKYADCYITPAPDPETVKVGQIIHYHVDPCQACSCQDWIAGDHSGEVLFIGDMDSCQDQFDSSEPLISAWIHPKFR